MQWSTEQEAALREADTWFRGGENTPQCFRIWGFAGSGKTTLARHFAEQVDGDVLFAAFTGKAAHVMRQKGCVGATTVHSLIYRTREKSRIAIIEIEASMTRLREAGREKSNEYDELMARLDRERSSLSQPTFKLNTSSILREAALLILDEASMIDARLGEDLMYFGTKILVLGDPGQLPPVMGAGFFTDHVPNIFLSQVHRQALDNPIIDLATRVRKGEKLEYGNYGESKVIPRSEVKQEDVMSATQILVGKNVTRHAINDRVRELQGKPKGMPVTGDRLVALRNSHDLGIFNGAIWNVEYVGPSDDEQVLMDISSEDDPTCALGGLYFHMHHFNGEYKDMSWGERLGAEEAAFGYGLTVHKSQGSAFDDVYLFDESRTFRDDAKRWLYTGITRAAKKVTVVT